MRQPSALAIARTARIFVSVVLCAAAPASLAAQTFRGTLRTTAAGAPVADAIVVLEDSTQQVRAASRSDSRGAFVLRSRTPGPFHLRVQRIGMRPYESALFALTGDTTAAIALNELPFSLPRIAARAASACSAESAASLGTWQLWEDVRTALLAISLTYSEHRSRFRIAEVRRISGGHPAELRRIALVEQSLSAAQPWTSFDPDTLALRGYVRFADDRLTFVSPDIDVLLSRSFENTHCFEPTLAHRRGTLGLSFDPARTLQNHTDIAGTFWIDSASRELRQLSFHHTGLPNVMGDSTGESVVTFATFGANEWFIPEWTIRAPIPALALNRYLSTIEQLRLFGDVVTGRDSRQLLWMLSGVNEEHGAVLAVYPERGAPDSNAIWTGLTGAIRLNVVTNTLGRGASSPAAGAAVQLVGSTRERVTGDSGVALFGGLTPGDYKLSVTTLDYALFAEPAVVVDVRVEGNAVASASAQLKSARTLSVQRCGDTLQYIIVGSVTHEGAPAAGTHLAVYDPSFLRGTRVGALKTTADGRFLICTKRRGKSNTFELVANPGDSLDASGVVRFLPGEHVEAIDLTLRRHGVAKSP